MHRNQAQTNNNEAKPLIVRDDKSIIISYNGRRLIKPINDQNKDMTNDEIAAQYIKVRNIKNDKV